MKPKIALLDDYHHRAKDYAPWSSAKFADFQFFADPITDSEALIDTLQPFEAIGLMRERTLFPKELINQLPNLKLIVTSGKKNASIDVAAANEQGITVCGTESPGHATAELAFLLTLSLSRQLIPLHNALQNDGLWQPVMGRDIKGQTLGIVGLGRLGGQLSQFAQAMGMRVIAWSENLTYDRCNELDVEKVSREALFENADTVSIHLRHSKRTDALIDAEDLRRLGPQGYIVNTSRAEIINSNDLRAAIDGGEIAGAASDVFDQEPAGSNHWMVKHPKVLATPHIGYCTDETFKVFYSQMLEAFEGFYDNKPVRVI